MKKILSIVAIILIVLGICMKVYASESFKINIENFNFDSNITDQQTVENLDQSYKLDVQGQIDLKTKNELMRIAKKYIYLYLGGNVDNEVNDVDSRLKELGWGTDKYDYNAKDANGDYNMQSKEYSQLVASEMKNTTLVHMFENGDICYDDITSIDFQKRSTYVNDIKISDYIATIRFDNIALKDIFDIDKDGRLKYKSNAEELLKQSDIEYKNIGLNLYIFIVDNNGSYKVAWGDAFSSNAVESYIAKEQKNELQSNLEISEYKGADLSDYYDWSKLNNIPDTKWEQLYNEKSKEILILQSYNGDNLITSSNGIFIKNGLIITSWTFLEESLKNNADIIIKDKDNNTYKIEGIVTANIEADLAVIKLKSETNISTNISFNKNIEFQDPVIMIGSKSGINLSISKGINISKDEDLQATILSSNNEKGAPVFDINGNLVGIISAQSNNASVSKIVNVKYIEELYTKFTSLSFSDIKSISYSDMKQNYYIKESQIKRTLTLTNKQWNKIKTIGNLEEIISLDLVKSSYYGGKYSLRYYNNINSIISSMQMAQSYIKELENNGYTKTLDSESKIILENNEYKIAVMEEFDYLIILISEK